MSKRYAIADVEEAGAYLRDRTLRSRYLAVTAAVDDQSGRGVPLEDLMGSSIDTTKLVSSLTLFRHVAATIARLEHLDECREIAERAERILTRAAAEGYPECEHTRGLLG